FTDDFKYHKDWSTESTAITVKNEEGVYTFRNVYLKQCDRFKIVNNGAWLGGNFTAVGEQFDIGDGGDITLYALATGMYDIVYDSVNGKLTVKVYEPEVTTASIAVTKQPTKTTYFKGEPFSAGGLEITATDTDGNIEVVDSYTLSGNNTDTVGTITITVTYDSKTATFTIEVSYITVTFKDGNTVLNALTATADYDGKITEPTAPTKDGYKFDGWYGDTACTEAWDFDADTVTEHTTLYANWIKLYTVTFDSNGGSDVDAIENVEHGSTITAPTDPTKDGFAFAGWTLNGNAFDFETAITGDITLVATWNGTTGTFMYYSTTPEDETSWVYGYKAEKNDGKNELVIRNVKIYDGMQFLVSTKKAEGNGAWLKCGLGENAPTFEDVVTIENLNGSNFKITLSDANYNGSSWDIYLYDLSDGVTVGEDGDLDKDTWACAISMVPVRDNTLRAADGSAMTATALESAANEVYIRGNFTGGFG
ncbi:MAG: InlB B-repeat-containing protein, partial [Clostridiales bacterium]|nr:InlB B-repeat-containing protein [Clostridiales bacterium]